MKERLQRKNFGSSEDVIEISDILFYIKGIEKIQERWSKFITFEGVEKN